MRVFVFLVSGILEDGSVPFFLHMNSKVFLEHCFFNESVFSFGFRHFGRRFCCLFSCEFIFFETFGFKHFSRNFSVLFHMN